MMKHNCPICNAAGLSDFTKIEIVCHQCNSNLKAFFLLNTISTYTKRRYPFYVFWGLPLLSILLIGLYTISNINKKEILATNMILLDSISNLKRQIVATEKPKVKTEIIKINEATVKYVVKKGDYPYKIAQFFYGDGNRYKQIEADNELKQLYTLKVGQILLIKISQD